MAETENAGSVPQSPKRLSGGAAAILGAFAAVIIPAVTALNGYFDLKLKEKELEQKVALEWIDKAIDPSRPDDYRKGAIGVLRIVLRGTALEPWLDTQTNEITSAGIELQSRREKFAA